MRFSNAKDDQTGARKQKIKNRIQPNGSKDLLLIELSLSYHLPWTYPEKVSYKVLSRLGEDEICWTTLQHTKSTGEVSPVLLHADHIRRAELTVSWMRSQ